MLKKVSKVKKQRKGDIYPFLSYLGLKLGGEVAHPLLVLAVLIVLELDLLNLALGALVTLHALTGAALHVAQLNLEMADFCVN